MAFGKHWEWRGFGPISPALRQRITRLPLWYETPVPTLDVYLWRAGATVNIKLRGEALKFKRLLDRQEPFEYWLEDEAELIPFPLGTDALALLSEGLALSLPDPGHLLTRPDKFLRYLHEVAPDVVVVEVRKQRHLYHYAAPTSEPVIVELSEVLTPQDLTSLALEHPQLDTLKAAYERFCGDAPHFQPASYWQMVGLWAQGLHID